MLGFAVSSHLQLQLGRLKPNYLFRYFNFSMNKEDSEKPWQKREQEFILIQLIELCKVYDYADEVGR